MKQSTSILASLSLFAAAGVASLTPATADPISSTAPIVAVETAKVGAPAPAFTLTDLSGKEHSLKDFKGKTVVLEWFCATCPYSGKASGRSVHSTGQVKGLMGNLKKADSDVVYLLIDSTANKSMEDVVKSDKAFKTANDLKAPILIDHTGKVGKAYGARSTPHMFVIDKEGVLQYQGAFSDQGKNNYVLNAVEAINSGKTPSPATTKPWGCGIKYASGSSNGRGGKGGKRRRN